MTNETYQKAFVLKEDISEMQNQIEEIEKYDHWITITTPSKTANYSIKFQKELLEWLRQKLVEYQNEFNEL